MTLRVGLSLLVGALLTVTLLGPVEKASAQAGTDCQAVDQTTLRGRLATDDSFPVVTIHGITGSDGDFGGMIDKSYVGAQPKPPRSLLDALAGSRTPGEPLPPGLPGVRVYSFSYTPDSLRWVDHAAVGGRFAALVDCLYARHGKPVSVIAHSMGGLVTRWVANTIDPHGLPRWKKLGKVITLGTPYEGSLLSSIANGATDIAARGSDQFALLNYLCGAAGTQSGRPNCGPIPLYSAFRSVAGRNLVGGSSALTALRKWPSGTAVTTLAGSQIVPLDLFGTPLADAPRDVGDIAVMTDSATADPSAGRIFRCRYDTASKTVRTKFKEILKIADPRERQAKLTGAFLSSPCYHSNLMRSVEVTNEVLGLMSEWLDEHTIAAVTKEEIRNLRLPEEVCDYLGLPPGERQLSDGRFAPPETAEQYLSIETDHFVLGDLDGDGIGDGAFSIMCANGVADKLDTVRVLFAADRRQVDVQLTRETDGSSPFSPDNEYLNRILDMSIRDGTLHVSMFWAFMDDPVCCPTTVAFGRYQFRRGAFSRKSVTVVDERVRTERLAAALNKGDHAGVAEQMADGWQSYFDHAMAQGAQFEARGCVRPTSFEERRYCLLHVTPDAVTYKIQWSGGWGPDLPGSAAVATPMNFED